MQQKVKIRTLNNREQKEQYINGVWEVLKEGYKNVKGGLHFKSKTELIEKTKLRAWSRE